jgi:hypothetical protein
MALPGSKLFPIANCRHKLALQTKSGKPRAPFTDHALRILSE